MNSAWVAVASILATYDISKSVDDSGTFIEPKVEFTDGLVRYVDRKNYYVLTASSYPLIATRSHSRCR